MLKDRASCAVCRLMRSLAFSGLAMGLGYGVAILLGGSKENCIISGIVVAAIIVFGFIDQKNKA